ncbi:MAG: 50S ribosomal protein L24 [Candidatus Lambdaproteobacteria bacterium]|nr:50S ribosomal protein L24 [Candidatus Lambdaproteobacteria bacterium]
MKPVAQKKRPKFGIKKGDQVQVIAGKAKGQVGEVLRVDPLRHVVHVKNVNMQMRHTKPRREGQQGGIVPQEGPLHISNVLKFCPSCERGVRKICTDNKGCPNYRKKQA